MQEASERQPPFRVRAAEEGDLEFLTDMLVEAVTADVARAQVLAEPRLRRYVEGWLRPGDGGCVAVGPEPPGELMGSVWWRLFPASAPGYGYVGDDVPELSIALAPGARGRGIGRILLQSALTEIGRTSAMVSLSVDRSNYALALYRSLGFRKVGTDGSSDLMVADLAGDGGPRGGNQGSG